MTLASTSPPSSRPAQLAMTATVPSLVGEVPPNAATIMALGGRVREIMLKLKAHARVVEPGGELRGKSRRFSVQDIANVLCRPKTSVFRALSQIAKSKDGAIAPQQRGYRDFTLNDLTAVRRQLGLSRHHSSDQRCAVVNVHNFKGGVGKSTTTAHLGMGLLARGYRVLLVDMDPQASLSTLLGIHPELDLRPAQTLIPYLDGTETTLDYAIRKTDFDDLCIIPAHLGLAAVDRILPERQAREIENGSGWLWSTVLANGLTPLRDRFDVILIDCPPSMAMLSGIAIQASDALLCPLRPSMLDFASSGQYIQMLGGLQAETDLLVNSEKRYSWLRFMLSMTEKRQESRDMEAIIRTTYGNQVMGATFPKLPAVADAGRLMRTVFDVRASDVSREHLKRAVAEVDTLVDEFEALIAPIIGRSAPAMVLNK